RPSQAKASADPGVGDSGDWPELLAAALRRPAGATGGGQANRQDRRPQFFRGAVVLEKNSEPTLAQTECELLAALVAADETNSRRTSTNSSNQGPGAQARV